jgi:SAM-dependent methyltransferase
MPASSQPVLQAHSTLRGIMDRHGVRCSPEEFHRSVNVLFHDFESEVYDREHRDMWESLPRQFELLVGDWLRADPHAPEEIRLLDIGCGTGLASDCLLKTAIGSRIKAIDLLDTSRSMLQQASRRASGWKAPSICHEGLLNALPPGRPYELIVTCSVLHHVPDLPGFLGAVRTLQAAGGVFLHLQDPNGDFLGDPELRQRMTRASRSPFTEWACRFTPRKIFGRIYRELAGKQGQDYLSKTNRALIEKGVVATPLSVLEIFSITDIHVQDGEGVSISSMESWLPDYACLSRRSYGFFGKLWSELPRRRQRIEEDLVARRALNGMHIGAAWRKNS